MAQQISGQKTIATAGTELALAATGIGMNVGVAIRALSTNTGKMYVGNDGAGAVSSSTGYELSAGDQIVISQVDDLANIMIDASENGEKVSWLIVDRY